MRTACRGAPRSSGSAFAGVQPDTVRGWREQLGTLGWVQWFNVDRLHGA